MYLADADTDQLGIVDAIMAVSALKGLFGFGKKKAALKQIEANAAGKWTSQFPPYADWTEFIDRPTTPLKKKGAEGTTSHRKAYEFWRKRKDSILIKHQIATPEDYGAWLVATYGLKDGWIDPKAKPGSPLYNNGPFAIETKIPIFDYDAIVKWAQSQGGAAQPVNVATIAPPALTPLPPPPPGFIERFAAQLQTSAAYPAQQNFSPPAAPENASAAGKSAASMLPLTIIGGAVLIGYALMKKPRRR